MVKIARAMTFKMVKVIRYFPVFPPSLEYCFIVITLAMEAIMVPRPPMSVPRRSALPLSVNPDRRIAAGTLLTNCEAMMPVSISWSVTIFFKNVLTAGSLPIFPINMKKNIKVRRSE